MLQLEGSRLAAADRRASSPISTQPAGEMRAQSQGVVIETPRLLISDFTVKDLEPLRGVFESLHQSGQSWFNANVNRPESIESFLQLTLANQTDAPRHTYRLAVRVKEPHGCDRLIGYVAICDIFNQDDGKPDAGVLINPQFQRNGYSREASITQMVFGFALGVTRLIAEVKTDNVSSINNVLGMGYSRVLLPDASPLVINVKTLMGHEEWYRFVVTREYFLGLAPELIENLARRYWPGDSNGIHVQGNDAVNAFIDRIFKKLPNKARVVAV
jgi:RimJ/RimL family protein N-acetyltransferase